MKKENTGEYARRSTLTYCIVLFLYSSSSIASVPAPVGINSLYLLKLFLALLFVLGIFLLLAKVVRQMNGLNNATSGQLSVIASLSIGTREKIVVVKVGEEQLLLGVGQTGVTRLEKLDKPIDIDDNPVVHPFKSHLTSIMGERFN